MISNQQVQELVRRANNSVRWTRALRRGLLYALLYSLVTNLFTNDALGSGILIAVCIIWVGLSIQARRKANLTAAASQMIAAGNLDEAREMLSRVCRGLCIHKPVLLMACHNLAVVLQKEKQWLAAWQLCELVRSWARKSNNEIRVLSEAVRAECSLAMNNLAGAYESLSSLSGTTLSITERLGVLQAEITYGIRAGHSDAVMADLPNKVALAGLLPTESAGLAHASLALAAHFARQPARRDWLWRRATLYCPTEELLAAYPVLRPLVQALSTAEIPACKDPAEKV